MYNVHTLGLGRSLLQWEDYGGRRVCNERAGKCRFPRLKSVLQNCINMTHLSEVENGLS